MRPSPWHPVSRWVVLCSEFVRGDVFIRTRAVQSHASEDGYFAALLDAAVEGIVAIDEAGRIEIFNRGAQEMFGYEPAEVIGQDVKMLMPEPYRSEHGGYLDQYHQTGRGQIIGVGREVVAVRKDGTVFPIDLAVNEVKFGKRRAYIGIIRDITHRKRLEQDVLNASEREQKRMAQDLHDGVCQELAGIALLAQSMQQSVQKGRTVTAAQLGTITELLQTAVRHGRALSHSLLPIDPRVECLKSALKKLAESTADMYDIECRFESNDSALNLSPSTSTHLYRIVQESVRDAVGHGGSKNILIELHSNPDKITVSVTDDGRNVAEDGRFTEELMLRMMRHRAKVIGAKLKIKSWTDGLRVVCELPKHHPLAKRSTP